jgi:hypothetical protein
VTGGQAPASTLQRPARAAVADEEGSKSPEEVARKAVARRPTTPSGRVSYTLTLPLPRDVAERLTAGAIREGRAIEALVMEILEAERGRTQGLSSLARTIPPRGSASTDSSTVSLFGGSMRAQRQSQTRSSTDYRATPADRAAIHRHHYHPEETP